MDERLDPIATGIGLGFAVLSCVDLWIGRAVMVAVDFGLGMVLLLAYLAWRSRHPEGQS